jgi:hypothetical protein
LDNLLLAAHLFDVLNRRESLSLLTHSHTLAIKNDLGFDLPDSVFDFR